MNLFQEARFLTEKFEKIKEVDRLEKIRIQEEWEMAHAAEMLENLKSELKDVVHDAATKGERSASLIVYSYSKESPQWVTLFRPPFDLYLREQGFKLFEFVESKDGFGDACRGCYKIFW